MDLDLFKWNIVYKIVGEAGSKTEGRLILVYFIQPKISTFQHLINMKTTDEMFCLLSFTLPCVFYSVVQLDLDQATSSALKHFGKCGEVACGHPAEPSPTTLGLSSEPMATGVQPGLLPSVSGLQCPQGVRWLAHVPSLPASGTEAASFNPLATHTCVLPCGHRLAECGEHL